MNCMNYMWHGLKRSDCQGLVFLHGEIVSDSSSGDLLARIVNKESKLFSEFLSSHLTLLHRCVSNDKKWWDIGLMVRKKKKMPD